MSAFLYGIWLQWKLDIRSKSLLITCYVVPLIFFAVMGGVFTAIMPEMKETLIQAMTVMGVSMGAFIGVPPSLVETYASDIKKVYKANGVPLYFGLVTMFISGFLHLLIMCLIILFIAPVAFDAVIPDNLPQYLLALAVFITVSLSIGSVLGLAVKNQAKLTMISQLIFLPSFMLSGIMFPAELLPKLLRTIGNISPATWGYKLMLNHGLRLENLWCLLFLLFAAVIVCIILLKWRQSE